jgi:hypothetical protein
VWPDNVHETGVSLDGQSGSPIVAAEARQVEKLEESLVTGPIQGFCAQHVEQLGAGSWPEGVEACLWPALAALIAFT